MAAELVRVDWPGDLRPCAGTNSPGGSAHWSLELLTEMDTADRWCRERNPRRVGSNAAPSADTLVATDSMRKWGCRALLSATDDEAKIVAALKCPYRHNVAMARVVSELRRHEGEVEALRQGPP